MSLAPLEGLPGVDVSGDGGLLKTIEKAGDPSSGTPPAGSVVQVAALANDQTGVPSGLAVGLVQVHYTGTLLDGSKFDSSRDRSGNFEFTIGEGQVRDTNALLSFPAPISGPPSFAHGQVIRGWDLGVATMHKGECATLYCRSDYAYGPGGSPPKIPANATLKFEVELLSWAEAEKNKWNMTSAERVAEAEAYKAKGTECFKLGQFDTAMSWYRKAADYVDSDFDSEDDNVDGTQKVETAALLTTCQLNEAQMAIKTEHWSVARDVCAKVLNREAGNVKALFRRGTALMHLSEFEAAKSDLIEAAKLDPKSKEIRDMFTKCKAAEAASKAAEKGLWAKAFK
jgi:peptidylprolyl isomerase